MKRAVPLPPDDDDAMLGEWLAASGKQAEPWVYGYYCTKGGGIWRVAQRASLMSHTARAL
ncbi:hypothetical protein O9K51_09774 [Purpureocillium lavendulum]|uniref:Uncharacterized protein n=1 Tax=Purpureocillium lavendulum TaxID=1247861 RepID=A0AB34FEW4_9HYPO|nr:hypothetical protein O9K51_09774 [Purpureocillium lavendulum]